MFTGRTENFTTEQKDDFIYVINEDVPRDMEAYEDS